jgi:hypothetical protein
MFEKKTPNDPILRIEREGEGRRWRKTPTWWPLEGPNVWWPLKGSKLGDLWKEKEKHHFHFFSLSSQRLLKHFFSLILRFYFTLVLDHYFTPFLPFPWPINCNLASQCSKSSTHSWSLNWFWLKNFFFPWIHGIVHDHVLQASTHTNESPWAWYCCNSPNSHTLVILLQIDFISGDEFETIFKGFYEIEDTSIFA